MTKEDVQYITTFITDRIIESKFEILSELNNISDLLREAIEILENEGN